MNRKMLVETLLIVGIVGLLLLGAFLGCGDDDDDDDDIDCGEFNKCLNDYQGCLEVSKYNWDLEACREDYENCLPPSITTEVDFITCIFLIGFLWDPDCYEPNWGELKSCGYRADCLHEAWYGSAQAVVSCGEDFECRQTEILEYTNDFKECREPS